MRMKQLALPDDGNFLIDSDGIRFRRPPPPLGIVECKMQTGWLPWYSRDFDRAVRGMNPAPNAYCDLGRICHITDDHHLDDGTPVSAPYEVHLVELYFLGV